MPTKSSFRPPILNPLVVKLTKAFLLPWLLSPRQFAIKTRFDQADIERLRQYKGQRMLLLPNHPSGEDPMVIMSLSKQLGEDFNYVAAREVFEYYNGLNGWVLQRCGVYSVIRGKADRDSFRQTRQILAEGLRRLVIFIEGEISSENDQLIPFEAGVLQLAFWALEDIKKATPHPNPPPQGERGLTNSQEIISNLPEVKADSSFGSDHQLPPLYAAPVMIKYIYDHGVENLMDGALDRLEKATGLPATDNKNYYERMRLLGQQVLAVHERGLNIKPSAEDTISKRVERVKERLLIQMESYLAITPPADQSYLDRIRAVRNRVDSLVYSYEETDVLPEYDKRNLELRQKTFTGFYQSLNTLVNFMTFQEGRVIEREDKVYAPDHFHPERMMELLHRLEKEILGSVVTRHSRTAVVKVGEIRNLTESYDAYLANKKGTVANLANQIEAEASEGLKNIQ